MNDGFSDQEREPRPLLAYPFETIPEAGSGQAVEVAPGVLWLRMPLGGALKAINVWALADGEGWTIVDTGIRSQETAQGWRDAFSGVLGGKPVVRVLCTHMHPDHVGMAGWILRKFPEARLWMTRLEYITCRMLAADTGREAPEDGVRFFKAAGWDEAPIETYRQRFGGFGRGLYPLPDSYHRISDGDVVRIGDNDWHVVVGCGHSPEHACLYQPELKLLISGDQVLPRISSNVSVHPTEPQADPLTDWLTSLAKVKAEVPDEVLVLPAHNEPFHGLHLRIDHLIRGHERGLMRLESRLNEPKRTVDVFGALFARTIGPDLLGMATGEAQAHLNCLWKRGRATPTLDAEGVAWWRAA
ncbi:MAG: MBL fold metallo-hydrolase [Pseudomonadota bacterium]|nr:MBL fold metallo-hydrolase [Pseudomonadota bacterium]